MLGGYLQTLDRNLQKANSEAATYRESLFDHKNAQRTFDLQQKQEMERLKSELETAKREIEQMKASKVDPPKPLSSDRVQQLEKIIALQKEENEAFFKTLQMLQMRSERDKKACQENGTCFFIYFLCLLQMPSILIGGVYVLRV